MDMNENIVKGKTIYFTGQFELGPQCRAERLGATIVGSMSEDVDWVVVGPGLSSTGLEQAQNLGIKVLDEKRFFELVDPNAWIENEARKAREMEEKSGGQPKGERRAEDEKRRAALEIKRATMPRVRARTRIVTDCCGGHGPARLIKEEDFLNLTAEQLREAICNGEHYPIVARDEDGDFLLLCTSVRMIPLISTLGQQKFYFTTTAHLRLLSFTRTRTRTSKLRLPRNSTYRTATSTVPHSGNGCACCDKQSHSLVKRRISDGKTQKLL